ncbi:MAG: hypothetical protein MI924_20105 [Chloroflexales bacterium]|nr:hypothetical protein [Chloroflexales bacterium]
MQERIRDTLQVLVGLPMWDAGRAANLIWFHFGAKQLIKGRKGDLREVGEYALHLQCAWRIVHLDSIVVASNDRLYPRDDPRHEPPDFDWMVPGANRCDEQLECLFTTFDPSQLIVQAVETDRVGGFQLSMGRGLALEVFPNNSFDAECWRFFCFSRDERHLVVTGAGIEDDDDAEEEDDDDAFM